jgi:hypothetical protein
MKFVVMWLLVDCVSDSWGEVSIKVLMSLCSPMHRIPCYCSVTLGFEGDSRKH